MASLSASGTPVYTRCKGQAGGAAALIVANGEKGHRSASRKAVFSVCPFWVPDVGESHARAMEKAEIEAAKKFSMATGRDVDTIRKDMARKLALDAFQAREYGFIDEVVD